MRNHATGDSLKLIRSIPDLNANRLHFRIDPLAASAPHIRSGLLRALAVTTPQRNPSFAALPTAIEDGIAGYDFASWGGVFAPAATPRDVLGKLNQELAKVIQSDHIRKRFEEMGLVSKSSSADEFGGFLISEMNRWKAVLGANK